MEFIDLKTQQARLRADIDRRIAVVLEHGQYIMGPEVFELEEVLAEYVGVKHCISASSGTDTLLLALISLDVRPGDEVITSPFTFIATGEMIALAGAVPVFIDIDPATYNMDPEQLEAAISERTRAIMPVSLYGQCADMDAINEIANRFGIPVIEDAAQSFGATLNGSRSCGLSTIGSTSFFPSKPLGCYGDGGALFTDDDELAQRMRELRVHGQERRYYHTRIGINGRLDTIQAAILLAKFSCFGEEVRSRAEIGARYTEMLKGCERLKLQSIPEGYSSVFAQYTIALDDRDALADDLKSRGIPIAIHYPVPLHLQPAFKGINTSSSLRHSEAASDRVLSLPMGPYLSESDQDLVVESVLASIEELGSR